MRMQKNLDSLNALFFGLCCIKVTNSSIVRDLMTFDMAVDN